MPEDKVTYQIWQTQKNFPKNHIILGSEKTNFWDMGDGPCGPCTEVFYDFHADNDNQPRTITDLEDKRFLEMGNIVFSEYYHRGEEYLPLQQKCVDFGGGLERIGMVLQGKKNTFETDLWKPVVKLVGSFVHDS